MLILPGQWLGMSHPRHLFLKIRSLFQHIHSMLTSVPAFFTEYCTILRALVEIPDYSVRMTKKMHRGEPITDAFHGLTMIQLCRLYTGEHRLSDPSRMMKHMRQGGA